MTLEERLAGWTGPSSPTEQDKQDRTERMIRDALSVHPAFKTASLRVFAKGSYANNTNVRADSDVDIAVECRDVLYWDEHTQGAHPASSPEQLRRELVAALRAKLGNEVDTSGCTAIRVRSSSARMEADVVPCFSHRYYFSATSHRDGTMMFKTDNRRTFVSYPVQHLAQGRATNTRTGQAYKRTVRLPKRVENSMTMFSVNVG